MVLRASVGKYQLLQFDDGEELSRSVQFNAELNVVCIAPALYGRARLASSQYIIH